MRTSNRQYERLSVGGCDILSVILVTYNSQDVLPRCIRALEHSVDASSYEVVVVDNASTDGTWPWIEAYAAKPRKIFARFVSHRLPNNRGYAHANNCAFEIAAGNELLLLNPDTFVEKDTISFVRSVLNRESSMGAVGCRLILENGDLDWACKRSFPTLWNSFCYFSHLSHLFPMLPFFGGYTLSYVHPTHEGPVECISGAFLMVKRSVYSEVGGLDEIYFMYGEDIDWCKRIHDLGFTNWYVGTSVATHSKGANGGKKSARSLRAFYESMVLYYDKHLRQLHGPFTNRVVHLAIALLLIIRLRRVQS